METPTTRITLTFLLSLLVATLAGGQTARFALDLRAGEVSPVAAVAGAVALVLLPLALLAVARIVYWTAQASRLRKVPGLQPRAYARERRREESRQ